ncbi:MAG: YggT family protein [Aggregatilineales bacterium]
MSLFGILILALNIYSLIVLARVLLSWFPNLDHSNPGVRFLQEATEPVLRPVREMLPPMQGMDFSPIVVMIGITILTGILRGFA